MVDIGGVRAVWQGHLCHSLVASLIAHANIALSLTEDFQKPRAYLGIESLPEVATLLLSFVILRACMEQYKQTRMP